jgi:hypothetical protein
MSKSLSKAAQVQAFHRQVFASSSGSLRQETKRMEVREAIAEIEPTSGAVAGKPAQSPCLTPVQEAPARNCLCL